MHNEDMDEQYHTATPYLMYRDAPAALDFVKSTFNAVERMCTRDDKGGIVHAEFIIGHSVFMLSQETDRYPELRGVESYGGSPVQIFLYLKDVDAVAERAVKAGATLRYPLEEKPYGRSCGFVDPLGLTWWVSSPPAEPRP
jgi:PhnB protein